MRIIIIGGGPAAVEAALTARQFNGNANITIFSAENILPYRRPLLVDFLGSEVTPARFFIHEQSFYDQHRIEIRLNTPVISIDWPENRIMLGNQTFEYYDKLLIACGAMASQLPASLFSEQAEGFVLHNWSDAVILKQKLKKSTHIMIVGGGDSRSGNCHTMFAATHCGNADRTQQAHIAGSTGFFLRILSAEKFAGTLSRFSNLYQLYHPANPKTSSSGQLYCSSRGANAPIGSRLHNSDNRFQCRISAMAAPHKKRPSGSR